MNRIFFPSLGTRAADGGWLVKVHAWCFRMHPLKIVVPVVRKLLGFERTRLTVAQKDIFAERARWMLASAHVPPAIAVLLSTAVLLEGAALPRPQLTFRPPRSCLSCHGHHPRNG